MNGFFRLPLLSLAGAALAGAAAPTIRYDCDPCLDRSAYNVRAIVHGTKTDPFWQQVKSAAVQAAKDMKVNLQMDLYDDFDTAKMSSDISSVKSNKPDALLVTIPSSDVASAVEEVVNANVPVLGLNSGASLGKNIGVLDFVAPDDRQGGKAAGEKMLEILQEESGIDQRQAGIQKALFVNDEKGNIAIDERLAGFQEALGVQVEELIVDGTDASSMMSALTSKFNGCPYQAVLLSGTRALPHAIKAYADNQCTLSSQPLGAFDTSEQVFDAIGNDQLSFTIGNQQYLQGALSTLLASMVASTGKSLAASAESAAGAYLSGPLLMEKESLPTDTTKTCMNDAFPVCPNSMAPDGSEAQCACTDRTKIKIGGVTHGVTTDSFWNPVYAASAQAALDMGVELFNEPFAPEEDEATLHVKMANRITDLCTRQDVDGIFVSIPSGAVVSAIQTCLDLNKPVMSINAGADTSESMGLMHHIGMLEYNAGLGAGQKMARAGITRAICINHAQGVNVVEERCGGFQKAIEDAGITYLGQIYVPDDNQALYVSTVEDFVNEEGDWEGMGILAAGGPQHVPVIALQARHPKATIGAFDVSLELYDAVDAGIKEFGMDQNAYMQGYMPVVLLTYAVTAGQTVSNRVIESGPTFVESSPSEAQQTCEDNMFVTCDAEKQASGGTGAGGAASTAGDIDVDDDDDDNTGLIVGLSVVAAVFALGFVYVGGRLGALNKHVRELEAQGQQVPDLSFSQKLSSAVKPVESVVNIS